MASSYDPKVAVRRALASYLRTNLSAGWPSLTVSEQWPVPQAPFPKQALTVLSPGGVLSTAYHQPVVWSTEPLNDGSNNATITYSYGIVDVPIQLDVWADYEAVRSNLAAAVMPLLNQNAELTLGTAGSVPEFNQAGGLVIPIPDYFNTTAEFAFDALATTDDTSGQVGKGEWRATFSGKATLYLLAQEIKPVMLTVGIIEVVNGAPPVRLDMPSLFIPYQSTTLTRPASFTFMALVDNGNAGVSDVTASATWTSDNSVVLNVSSGATVTTGASPGTAVISATYLGVTATTTVTVL